MYWYILIQKPKDPSWKGENYRKYENQATLI